MVSSFAIKVVNVVNVVNVMNILNVVNVGGGSCILQQVLAERATRERGKQRERSKATGELMDMPRGGVIQQQFVAYSSARRR